MRLYKIQFRPDRTLRLAGFFRPQFYHTAALVLCCFLASCAPVSQNTASTFAKQAQIVTVPTTDTAAPDDQSSDEQQSLIATTPSPDAAEPDTVQEEEQGTPSEPEATIDQEIANLPDLGDSPADSASQQTEAPDEKDGFPLTMNKQVQYYLDFFQNKQHDTFARWLERSGRYLPLIRQELQDAGLPQELAYLPLIESGFNLNAYSKAHAVGPWQFIKSTGRLYGLSINSYVDERRDIVASTKAAAQFLKELHQEFDSWYLAVASYNAGAGKIKRAMNKTGSDNFWQLAKTRHLCPETKLYVPKLIAAIMIARAPEDYGFADLHYDPPMDFETIEVPPWTPLKAVALASNTDYAEIRDMNRELGKEVTPPSAAYTLKVPTGKGHLVEQNLNRVRAIVRTSFKDHIVGRHETIGQICREYNLNTLTLLKANNLRKSKLTTGQHLRVPVQVTEYRLLPADALVADLDKAADGLILHRIRPGETLSSIAHRYGVSIQQLASWNGITDARKIRAGRQLALYIENSLYADNDTQPAVLVSLNKEKPATQKSSKETVTYYNVRKGDSLWKIARKFQLTTDQIRHWNNLESNMIKPGHRLKIKLHVGDEEA